MMFFIEDTEGGKSLARKMAESKDGSILPCVSQNIGIFIVRDKL